MERVLPESEEYLEDVSAAHRILDDGALQEPISVLDPAVPVCIGRNESVAAAVRRMQDRHIGCVLIVEATRLVGIFTERDLLRDVVGSGVDPEQEPVERFMTGNPERLRPSDPIAYALNKMSLGGFRHVPLVDDGDHPLGVISVKDIVDYIAEFFATDVQNLPPEPGLDVTKSRDGA